MAPIFRYRYVDIGAVFTGDSRKRDAENGADSPSTLFSNELACDVGGTCWGANEPLAILDHHLPQQAQFPSAAAAVLHKAKLIHGKFAHLDDVIWLVTHKEPDFDAFCSMYLARWLIEEDASAINWESYGVHPEGWLDLPGVPKIDWLDPDLRAIPVEHRWAFLLAGYASMLEMRRHISCPRQRALRSILYAALKRGRDYLAATSGATEFFNEVRAVLTQRHLNPVFDSVLEGNPKFAPELALLDREGEAYDLDLQRSRRALVYLPESEAPSPDFFQHPKKLAQEANPEVSPENLLLSESFRIATDGIYLRDPQCALFQQWAWVDVENSSLGAGFEFTAIAQSNARPEGAVNTTEYVFAIDPERANGRHLYTVWSRLQTDEVEALRARQQQRAAELAINRAAESERSGGTLQSLLSDPWLGGQSRSSTIVDTPRRGTLIGPAGVRSDLRDDPIVEAVRTELEAPIYISASLVAGPQVTVYDFATSPQHQDTGPRHFDLNALLMMPPPEKDCFRFASIGLRADVPIASGGSAARLLARQIGETLWHTLYPDRPGEVPQPHLVIRTDAVGVWSERGVAVAQKPSPRDAGISAQPENDELRGFKSLMSLLRDIGRFAAEQSAHASENQAREVDRGRTLAHGPLQAAVAAGEDLAGRALELQRALTLPERDLLRHFCEAIEFEQLMARLRDLNHAAAEDLRHAETSLEARRQEKQSDELARAQRKLRWLEVLVVGFIALEIVSWLVRNLSLGTGAQETLALFVGPLALGCAALFFQPWKTKQGGKKRTSTVDWLLVSALLVWLLAWLSQLLRW